MAWGSHRGRLRARTTTGSPRLKQPNPPPRPGGEKYRLAKQSPPPQKKKKMLTNTNTTFIFFIIIFIMIIVINFTTFVTKFATNYSVYCLCLFPLQKGN